MDLRTIMNSDASGVAQNPPALQPSPARPPGPDRFNNPQQNEVSTPGSSYKTGYLGRPPQPPPLQPPHRSPSGSSSYGSAQSPYQYNSASTLSAGAQSQHIQSPAHASHSYPSGSQGSNSAIYNPQHVTPLASPYTPQSGQQLPSYFSHRGSQSIQESPHSAGSQQHFPPQPFSPAQRGQPTTPLGRPSVSYQRPSHQANRPPSSGLDTQQAQISSVWGVPESQAQDPKVSPVLKLGLLRQDSRPIEQAAGRQSLDTNRERSVSVSPKTIVMPAPRQASVARSQGRASSPYRSSLEDGRWKENPVGSVSSSTQRGSGSSSLKYQPATSLPSYSLPIMVPLTDSFPPPRNSVPNDASAGPVYLFPAPKPEAGGVLESPAQPPKRKKMRYEEPPIYARKASRGGGRSPVIPNRRPPISKHATTRFGQEERPSSSLLPSAMATPPTRTQVNGDSPVNGSENSTGPPESRVGLLGPWEPSITGIIPHEEITHAICHFLFRHVVVKRDIGAAAAGAAATGQGAILEVEAKLGQLIDRDRGGRLRLPVLTECVINKDDPAIRTSFESSMTPEQHRAMNNFLNDAVKASMPQAGSNRIALSYAHKKERDTFYDVAISELPPVVQHNLHPRHKPRVRVTTDQRSGEVLSKIVKCRIADLDVYSPQTKLDWRVSVNLEMNYDGDIRSLPVFDAGGPHGRSGERNKDRMSYRHLAYQIDLTQVAMAEHPVKTDLEHELEIEISAAEVRRQGELALAGDLNNQYEVLIKGFVDNIRILARAVPGQ